MRFVQNWVLLITKNGCYQSAVDFVCLKQFSLFRPLSRMEELYTQMGFFSFRQILPIDIFVADLAICFLLAAERFSLINQRLAFLKTVFSSLSMV